MQVIFVVTYVLIGLVQIFAIVGGVGHALDLGTFLSVIVAAVVTYIPLVGSALGVYGAVSGWDWSIWQAVLLFFWYLPVAILFAMFGAFAER